MVTSGSGPASPGSSSSPERAFVCTPLDDGGSVEILAMWAKGSMSLHARAAWPNLLPTSRRSSVMSPFDAAAEFQRDPDAWRLSHEQVRNQQMRFLNRAVEFAARGFSASEAAAWTDAGVHRARDAFAWDRVDGTPQDAEIFDDWRALLFLAGGGLPRLPEWGALWPRAPKQIARLGHACGQSPAEVAAFVDAFTMAHSVEPVASGRGMLLVWPEGTEQEAHEMLLSLPPQVRWDQFGQCLLAGLSPQEARSFIVEGGDMASIRVMVGLIHPSR